MTTKLDENIYVIQSTGFINDTNWVCKLNTALNELKQSACVGKTKFVSILTNFGLMQNLIDQSIFIDQDIVVVTYVDDIIIFSKNVETINKFKTHISKHVDIIDLNNAKFYLNMKIIRKKKNHYFDSTKICQKFVGKICITNKILQKFLHDKNKIKNKS